MRKINCIGISFVCALTFTISDGRAAELIGPIDRLADSSGRIYRQYSLDDAMYFAEKTHFLTLDTETLFSEEILTISIPNEPVLKVKRLAIQEVDWRTYSWSGVVIEPRYPAYELGKEGAPQAEKDTLADIVNSIHLVLLFKDTAQKETSTTFLIEPIDSVPQFGGQTSEVEKQGKSLGDESFLETTLRDRLGNSELLISGTLSIPALAREYKIIAIEKQSNLYALLKLDPDKRLFGRPITDESIRKHLDYQDFLEQLDARYTGETN